MGKKTIRQLSEDELKDVEIIIQDYFVLNPALRRDKWVNALDLEDPFVKVLLFHHRTANNHSD